MPQYFRPYQAYGATAYVKDRLVEEPFDTYQSVKFKDIANEEDFFEWMENVFIPFVLPSSPSDAQTETYNTFERADLQNADQFVRVETIDEHYLS